MARSRESLSNKLIHVEKWTNMCNRSQERERRRRWPHVTRRRTMLLFREISCDFRVPSRCREPKVETLRLRSAKVGAPTSSPIKVNLKANCDDLQAEQQAQRFSRVSDSATRRALVYRAKRLWSEFPRNSCKSQFGSSKFLMESRFPSLALRALHESSWACRPPPAVK